MRPLNERRELRDRIGYRWKGMSVKKSVEPKNMNIFEKLTPSEPLKKSGHPYFGPSWTKKMTTNDLQNGENR